MGTEEEATPCAASIMPADKEARANKRKNKRWFPLESNPSLLNAYISKLGFDTSLYQFVDVYSTEDWAIEMIPQPVVAVLMLYPITRAQENHRAKESRQGQSISSGVWHMKQFIGNACGTIGILHALANVPDTVKSSSIDSDSWLGRYYAACPASLSPMAKAETLDRDEEIEEKHDATASDSANSTSRPGINDDVDTHFVALVHVEGKLYELDGRKEGPIPHGNTNQDSLLKDACNVVETFMTRDPEEMRFTILALAPTIPQED